MSFQKQKEISGHAAAVYCCTARGNYIYSGSADKYVARWLLNEGTQDKFAIRFEQAIYALELIGDTTLAVGVADGKLYFFDIESRVELKCFTQHTVGIFAIKSNSEKQQIYVADADGNLSVWDYQFNLLIYLPLDCGKIRSIAVDEFGERIALACQDGTVRVFDTTYFNELITLNAHNKGATAVLFHPLKKDQLISGGKDALLKLWDLENSEEQIRVVAHTFAIYDIVSLEQGKTILTASRDKNVKVWNAEDLQFLKRLDFKVGGHRHSVNALAKIDENTVVSCSDDKRLIVWERE